MLMDLCVSVGVIIDGVSSIMAPAVRVMRPVVIALSLGHITMVVMVPLKAGNESHRHRPGHQSVGAHQHQRSADTRNLFWLILSRPRPHRTHDDVGLQQQHGYAGGPDRFRLTGRRSEGRPHDAGHHP